MFQKSIAINYDFNMVVNIALVHELYGTAHSCRNAQWRDELPYVRITLHAISEHQGEGRSRNQKATANKNTTERKRSPLPATYLFGNFRSSCSTEELLGSGKQNRGGNPRTHAAMHMTGRITVRAIAFQTMRIPKIEGR